MNIIKCEKQKYKLKNKEHEQRIRDLLDDTKQYNIYVIGAQKEKPKVMRHK